ncbi:MAG TPA: acetyl-CoA carboxylase biotin carboxyl carrier protein [Ohtaekwangia sp.]|nr:acetyl-CoA carboxylase biotin carboxyl carrier protein [Ohtaekwangia sp.]
MSKNRASKSSARKEEKPARATSAASQPETKTSEIRDLIDFISKTGLNEVNIETKELKLHVKREPDQKIFKSSPMMAPISGTPQVVQQTAPQPVQTATPTATPKAEKPAETAGTNLVEIKSPMIGTFYRSASPDSPPFVSVGDKVTKGQTVCIIEAMKLFNEIESEHSGTIVKVMLENANPVEYDQVLFLVEPD